MSWKWIVAAKLLILTGCTGTLENVPLPQTHTPPKDKIARYAVVVGLDYCGTNPAPLRYCSHDAHRMREILEASGFHVEEVIRDFFTPYEHTEVLEAVRAQVKEIWTKVKVNESDYENIQFIFYYSGHGSFNEVMLDDVGVGMHLQDLDKLLSPPEETATKWSRVVILDSCRQATAAASKPVTHSSDSEGIAWVYACEPESIAKQRPELLMSLFTYHLWQEVASKRNPQRLHSLLKGVESRLRRESEQRPRWVEDHEALQDISLNVQRSATKSIIGFHAIMDAPERSVSSRVREWAAKVDLPWRVSDEYGVHFVLVPHGVYWSVHANGNSSTKRVQSFLISAGLPDSALSNLFGTSRNVWKEADVKYLLDGLLDLDDNGVSRRLPSIAELHAMHHVLSHRSEFPESESGRRVLCQENDGQTYAVSLDRGRVSMIHVAMDSERIATLDIHLVATL